MLLRYRHQSGRILEFSRSKELPISLTFWHFLLDDFVDRIQTAVQKLLAASFKFT